MKYSKFINELSNFFNDHSQNFSRHNYPVIESVSFAGFSHQTRRTKLVIGNYDKGHVGFTLDIVQFGLEPGVDMLRRILRGLHISHLNLYEIPSLNADEMPSLRACVVHSKMTSNYLRPLSIIQDYAGRHGGGKHAILIAQPPDFVSGSIWMLVEEEDCITLIRLQD